MAETYAAPGTGTISGTYGATDLTGEAVRDTVHPLDDPVHSALTGPQAALAERRGRVLRYQPDVSDWTALPADAGPEDWHDLAELAGPGTEVAFVGLAATPPAGWELTFHVPGVQLVDTETDLDHDPEAVHLGPADVPEMLELVERTRPGPFLRRTVEAGTYLGIRREGHLVAMAGERIHPTGWTEISAVCTLDGYRGQGLGGRLVRAVAAGVRQRGETPFLHASAENTSALRLYETLGFTLRRTIDFTGVRVPESGWAR
ncbi:GNAT family N-acetyltransferase [Streptomyces sp. NPDC058045]|uniref:GNAT family N-acetyltransferase n=1 Tax=Streptomyces sp. NPDC058045 TaxID=3346311 RepID=UPI0036E00060